MNKFVIVGLLLLGAVGAVVLLMTTPTGSARLGLSFVGYTNGPEYTIARFSITNHGSGDAFLGAGRIELKSGGKETVPTGSSLHILPRSTGKILDVNIGFGRPSEPWRLTCYYAERSLKTEVFDWQNRPNGLGHFVVSHLPFTSVGGVTCGVVATSDWLQN